MSEKSSTLIAVAAVFGLTLIAGAGYMYLSKPAESTGQPHTAAPHLAVPSVEPTPVPPAIETITDNTAETTTDNPEATRDISATPKPENTTPLPELDNSDSIAHAELQEIFSQPASLLFHDELIRKLVLSVDNLSRGETSNKYPPASISLSRFDRAVKPASTLQDPPRYIMGSDTFDRYNNAINLFAAADKNTLAKLYQWGQPLLQQAYEELGNGNVQFQSVALSAIDNLLDAPEITGDMELVRPSVGFKYADPALEKLSDSDKLMLRIGPQNRQALKAALKEFKLAIQ